MLRRDRLGSVQDAGTSDKLPSYFVSSIVATTGNRGGEGVRGAVGGGRQTASRANRTRIDLWRSGREDFAAARRPQ